MAIFYYINNFIVRKNIIIFKSQNEIGFNSIIKKYYVNINSNDASSARYFIYYKKILNIVLKIRPITIQLIISIKQYLQLYSKLLIIKKTRLITHNINTQ